MEENIVDSSKFKISLISLDSRFADTRSCNNSEFKIVLPNQMKNVIRIRLASIEVPLVEYAFSEAYGNLTCAVKIANNPNFVKVPPITAGNYTAAQLISAVQGALQTVHSGFTVTLDGVTGRITIANTSVKFQFYGVSFNKTIATQLSFWGLGYYLGFRDAIVCSTENPLTNDHEINAPSILNIAPNHYYLVQLWGPDNIVNCTHRLEDKGFLEVFAKAILKDDMFTNAYDDNSNLVRKEFTWLAPFSIPFFRVALLNPYGRPVDMMNMNWSITIEVTEVVNSKTYTRLQQNYERN
jgi:hypothetical protein